MQCLWINRTPVVLKKLVVTKSKLESCLKLLGYTCNADGIWRNGQRALEFKDDSVLVTLENRCFNFTFDGKPTTLANILHEAGVHVEFTFDDDSVVKNHFLSPETPTEEFYKIVQDRFPHHNVRTVSWELDGVMHTRIHPLAVNKPVQIN